MTRTQRIVTNTMTVLHNHRLPSEIQSRAVFLSILTYAQSPYQRIATPRLLTFDMASSGLPLTCTLGLHATQRTSITRQETF